MSTAVFFDLDGTLMDHAAAEQAAALHLYATVGERAHSDSPEAFVAAWREAQETHFRRYSSGELTFTEQRRARIREVFGGVPDDGEADHLFATYLMHYESRWSVFEDVLPCLDQLECGHLGVITNGDPGQQRLKLKRLGLMERVHGITCSGALGVSKPDPRIFQHACHAAGVEARRAIHIGDSHASDYEGALSAGLRGILIERGEPSRSPRDVLRVASLTEVPPIVQTLVGASNRPQKGGENGGHQSSLGRQAVNDVAGRRRPNQKLVDD